MKRLLASLLGTWLISLAALIPAFGADSTSFDPTTVQVKAKGSGGVPVGTIVAWPVAKNPSDMSNWLECNGQSISQSAFPELFAVTGAKVPDLRGYFLRGYGGKSAGLGVHQDDAILDHQHTTSRGNWTGDNLPYFQGAGVQQGTHTTNGVVGARTASENRPVNKAVRYLIRARP